MVWVIPVIAALIGGWMVFQNLLDEKLNVTVKFKDAAGIEAGKTLVKFRDVVVGKVISVEITGGAGDIEVQLQFDDVEPEKITETTRFWVVKPRVGLEGVTGLDTLLSGAYIEVDPSLQGQPATEFIGLEEPGIHQLGNPGTKYKLKTYKLGSVGRGAPVKYRDVNVGKVSRYRLAEDSSSVEIEVFIRAPYDKLVNKDTRFWHMSGAAAAARIFEILETPPPITTNDRPSTAAPAPANSVFSLYESETAEKIAVEVAFHVPMKLYFDNVQGLEEGAPATYKGLRIGTVDKVSIEANEDETELVTFAMLRIEPDRLPGNFASTTYSDERRTQGVHRFFETLAAKGVRAQLKTGNLLTGKALVLFDDSRIAEPASIEYVDGIPVFPTIPQESFEAIIAKVDSILAKIDAMPIEKIGGDLAVMSGNLADTSAKIDALPIEDIGRDPQHLAQGHEEGRVVARALHGRSDQTAVGRPIVPSVARDPAGRRYQEDSQSA